MERTSSSGTSRPAGKAALIEGVAARQHGIVSRSQLLERGLSSAAIGRRIASGQLRPLHAGIYQVGPLEARLAPELAAVLAGGDSAVLSHDSALRAWNLLPSGPRRPVHVSVLGRGVRRRPGIVFHWVGSLDDAERVLLDGVPITSPIRTLVDAARTLGSRELANAVGSAERLGLVTPTELVELGERYRGRRGIGRLRALVQSGAERPFTRSEAEDRCLALLGIAGLPPPQTNVLVGPYELDFFWPDANVAVEVDGWAFHRTRSQFESDRRKDNWLRGRGIEVVRLTWRQITRTPVAAAVQVGQALTLAHARRPGRQVGTAPGNGPAASGHR